MKEVYPNPEGPTTAALKLWELILGDERGLLQIFTGIRGPDGSIPRETIKSEFFNYPDAAQTAARWALEKSDGGREVYFCAHLLTEPRRKKENAAPVSALWGDLDGCEIPVRDLAPTAVVESSPDHWHAYWRLMDPVPPELAERLNERLAREIGADPSGFDLTQLLRVPGTVNHKYADRPTVHIIEMHRARAYSPVELAELLPELPERGPGQRVTTTPVVAGEPPVQLDEKGMRVWRGEDPKYTDDFAVDRSASLMKIGRVLYDAGANRAVIVAALKERDVTLGYRKFAYRPDAEQRYYEIVDELERNGRRDTRRAQLTAEAVEPAVSSKGTRTKLTVNEIADALTAEDHFAQDAGGKLYRFAGGAYRQYAERYIRRRVKELLEAAGRADEWSSYRANEVVEYIRTDAPELWERPPLNEVNVLNGILNVETRELRRHDPAFLSPVQTPVAYDPSATCPEWEKFVAEVFPEDAQDLAFELAADLITPSRSAQKAILLLGEGSNGKSTYLRALTSFVGSTNASGASLHKLESDRFSTARLIGKLANICPDLPSTHLTETSVFKAITGGDDLHAEYKYRESFEFQPYCRLVFSANHVPRSGDASHAFFRRWLVIPFERTFEPDEQIPREELDAKLADPRELAGVLNRALDVLPRVRREGFTESKSMREAWAEFRAMTDPVSVWLAQNTIEAAEAFVPKDALAKAYNEFCDKVGRPGMNKKGFGRAVKRAFPQIEDGQKSVAGKMTWCWLGIGLKSGGTDPTTHTTNGTNEKPPICFENEKPTVKQGGRDSQKTNKKNSVSSVSSVSGQGPTSVETYEVDEDGFVWSPRVEDEQEEEEA